MTGGKKKRAWELKLLGKHCLWLLNIYMCLALPEHVTMLIVCDTLWSVPTQCHIAFGLHVTSSFFRTSQHIYSTTTMRCSPSNMTRTKQTAKKTAGGTAKCVLLVWPEVSHPQPKPGLATHMCQARLSLNIQMSTCHSIFIITMMAWFHTALFPLSRWGKSLGMW